MRHQLNEKSYRNRGLNRDSHLGAIHRIEHATGRHTFHDLLLPGYVAIVLLWGSHGGVVSELVSQAVLIGVNAVVDGLITFGIFTRVR
jgi:hypothetical protein